MKKDSRPRFRFGMMIAAALFLANPNINLIDPLPDFVGYLLLALSLSDADVAFPYFAEARSGFLKLMWISLSKIPAALVMLSIWSRDASQRSIIPVFTLSYAALELLFLFPALSAFFEGVFYLGTRYDCEAVLKVPAKLAPSSTDGIKRLTFVFFVTKLAMSTLPEFALASVRQYNPEAVVTGSRFVISSFYPLFLLFGMLIVLIIGVTWANVFVRWIAYLRRDGGMDRLLEEHLREKAQLLERRHAYGAVAAALAVLTVAVGCGIDLVFDDINMLPDFFSAVLFVIGCRMLRPQTKKATIPALLFGIYGAVSLVSYVLKLVWVERFSSHGSPVTEAGTRLFRSYEIVSVAETVLFCAAVILALPMLADVWRAFRRRGLDDPVDDGLPADAVRPLTSRCRRRLWFWCAFGWLSGLLSLANIFVSSWREVRLIVNLDGDVPQAYRVFSAAVPRWGWFWLIPLVLSLVWLVCSISVLGEIRESVRDRIDF